MRRSKAPSQREKFISPLLSRNNTANSDSGLGEVINKPERSNASILHLLKNKNQQPTPEIKENVSNMRHSQDDDQEKQLSKKMYNVVYGKPSKKKHKTWEGDGFLEVGIKTVILKDSEGKTLGSSSNVKIASLIEGSRIFVGSKEVEILDLVSDAVKFSTKRPHEDMEEVADENISKKITQLKKKKLISNKIVEEKQSVPSIHSKIEALIMPRPDDQHQWECNLNHEPVTDVTVDPNINKILRPHQREGVIFLYRCVTGIRSLCYTGAILADEMGLGKTLQIVVLIWTLLRQGPYGGKPLLKHAIIVVPSSLVQNWNNEFIRWIGSYRIRLFPVNKKNKAKDFVNNKCPVMIISYEQFVRNIEDIKHLEFDLIVCDEGHRLKNSNIQATNLLLSLKCKQRILLTGTPMQNDLQEFYTLVDFVNPGILGTPFEFRKNYANAIIASREPNASDELVEEGKEKADELNRFTSGFILRRTQSVIGSFLPEKNEYVVFCAPTMLQKKIYTMITNMWLERMESNSNNDDMINHLSVITAIKKVCNHPYLIKPNKFEEYQEMLIDVYNEELASYKFQENDSGKLAVVVALLKQLSKLKERIILVSNFTQTLDLLANLCERHNYKYLKFDGSTAASKRSEIVERFNSKHSDIFVLLLSSKAGGVGLNLIGASRLVLYDSDWNPAVDLQAMARIWREGQKKNVYIYRLFTTGTIEEKIFQRQLTKAGLSEAIVDPNCKSSVKLSKEEIMDLFDFTGTDNCLTHEVLKCNCCCDGSIPQESIDLNVVDEEIRDCQLTLDKNYTMPTLRMNQLFQWEHHGVPVQPTLLDEMKMDEAKSFINFVFRNVKSVTN